MSAISLLNHDSNLSSPCLKVFADCDEKIAAAFEEKNKSLTLISRMVTTRDRLDSGHAITHEFYNVKIEDEGFSSNPSEVISEDRVLEEVNTRRKSVDDIRYALGELDCKTAWIFSEGDSNNSGVLAVETKDSVDSTEENNEIYGNDKQVVADENIIDIVAEELKEESSGNALDISATTLRPGIVFEISYKKASLEEVLSPVVDYIGSTMNCPFLES